jgi:ABC-type phosphate transport system permease subunit
MLCAILICHIFALVAEVFLEKRVHDEFFSNRMSCQLPSHLAAPSSSGIVVLGVYGLYVFVIAIVYL